MKNLSKLVLVVLLSFGFNTIAQNSDGVAPFWSGTADKVTAMPSIASRTNLLPSTEKEGQVQDGRASKYIIVPGKGSNDNDALIQNQHRTAGAIQGKTPSLVFETAQSNSSPTDPAGAVGPNHYFAVFNTGFRIFDKDGVALTGQLGVGNIFPDPGCCDLTVSYDNLADRWVVSFLNGGGAGVQVAVSNGPDPLTTDWTVYFFSQMNDYNKLSVWRDGYYLTENTPGANKLWVLERDFDGAGVPNPSAQLVGFALPGIVTSGFHAPQAMNITDDNHPTTGGCPIVYMQDDAWPGVGADHVKLWLANMDWSNTANSTVTTPLEIAVTPFISTFDNGSFANLTQPNGGADIDALQATIMNQGQFRKFGTHNSMIFNFVVDTDATGGELAGVRWMEFRQATDDGPWSLFQEGTYTSPDGKHAWNASLAMDIQGNIGMGYTGMAGPTTPTDGSVDLEVSSYYTGRFAADAAGTMTITEELIAKGNGNIPNFRYSDYSKIDVDPSNDKAFWYVTEYIGTSGGRANVAGVFQIAPNFADDIGVISIDTPVDGTLTATEDVTVTIFNFGENDATGFDVTYQIDGGATITEAFTGTLASATSTQYTFAAQGDFSTVGQTYSITASTVYGVDLDNSNDSVTKDVTHLDPNDIGVTAISSPTTGQNLSDAEAVTVTISNFGGLDQSNFDVTFDLDGAMTTETVAGPLAAGGTLDYTFTATVDLSAFQTYTLSATTSLAGDVDTSNDSTTVTIENLFCMPTGNCSFGDGFQQFTLADIDNASDCEGYGDFTDQSTELVQGETYDLTVTTGYGDQFVSVWVDFNDNFVFESDELIVDNFEIADGQAGGVYTETIAFPIAADAALGEHILRAKSNWNGPNTDDACVDVTFGETEDYTVVVTEALGLDDNDFATGNFTITETNKNIFDVSFTSQNTTDMLELTVFNVLGQRMVYYKMENNGGEFNYNLDMSYIAKGVYLVRVGNSESGKVKRLLIK